MGNKWYLLRVKIIYWLFSEAIKKYNKSRLSEIGKSFIQGGD